MREVSLWLSSEITRNSSSFCYFLTVSLLFPLVSVCLWSWFIKPRLQHFQQTWDFVDTCHCVNYLSTRCIKLVSEHQMSVQRYNRNQMKLLVFTHYSIYCDVFSVNTFEPSRPTKSCTNSVSPKSASGTSGPTFYGGIPGHVAGVWVGNYPHCLTGKFVCCASLPALPLWQVTNNTLELFSALKNVFL